MSGEKLGFPEKAMLMKMVIKIDSSGSHNPELSGGLSVHLVTEKEKGRWLPQTGGSPWLAGVALILSLLFFVQAPYGCSSKDKDKKTGDEKRTSSKGEGVGKADAKTGALKEKDNKKTSPGGVSTKTDRFNSSLRAAIRCLDNLNLEKKKSSGCPEPREVEKYFFEMIGENREGVLGIEDYLLKTAAFVDRYEKMLKKEQGLEDNELARMVRLFNQIVVKHNTARMDMVLPSLNEKEDTRPLDPNSFRHRLESVAASAVKLYGVWYGKHGGRAGVPIDLESVETNSFYAAAVLLDANFRRMVQKMKALKCKGDKGRCESLSRRREQFVKGMQDAVSAVMKAANDLNKKNVVSSRLKGRAEKLRTVYSELVGARAAITRKSKK